MPDLHLLTGAYALDALDDVERAGFERHLRCCASCAAEVVEFREVTARLGDPEAATPRPELRARVLADVSRTRQVAPAGRAHRHRPAPRRLLSVACAAAVLAASAGLGGVAWQGHRSARDRITTAGQDAGRADRLTAVITDPDRTEVVQPATGGGTATVLASRGTAVVVTRRLPAPPSGMIYEVWLFDGSGVHPVQQMAVRDGAGQALVEGAGAGTSVAVSLEPVAGSARPSTEPVLKVRLS